MEDENKYIFISCSFNEVYFELLKSLLFTILFLGYEPY